MTDRTAPPCDGYAQAYTMLLAAANIESYVISAPGHSWNLVKIGEKYYQTDVTWDDPRVHDINWNWITKTYDTPYSTDYTHFLKSHAEMVSLHDNRYKDLTFDTYLCELHELLNQYTGTETKSLLWLSAAQNRIRIQTMTAFWIMTLIWTALLCRDRTLTSITD